MAFTYVNGVTAEGNSSTIDTGVHGISITAGDLVVAYIVSNDNTAIGPTGTIGAAWTESWDENPDAIESAYHAFYWKVAGGSEPTSYTWEPAGSNHWCVTMKVFDTAADVGAVVDVLSARVFSSVDTITDVDCEATNGETVAADSVSIAMGGKDNRTDANYGTADNSFVSCIGSSTNMYNAMSHKIRVSSETMNFDVDMDRTSGGDVTDYCFSGHVSFVEDSGGGGGDPPPTGSLAMMGLGV